MLSITITRIRAHSNRIHVIWVNYCNPYPCNPGGEELTELGRAPAGKGGGVPNPPGEIPDPPPLARRGSGAKIT